MKEHIRPNREDINNCRWFRNGVNHYNAGKPFLTCAGGPWVEGYNYAQSLDTKSKSEND